MYVTAGFLVARVGRKYEKRNHAKCGLDVHRFPVDGPRFTIDEEPALPSGTYMLFLEPITSLSVAGRWLRFFNAGNTSNAIASLSD
jgi:hypothetical protein